MDERRTGIAWQEHGKGMYSIEAPLLTDDDISNAPHKWAACIATRSVAPARAIAEEKIVIERASTTGEEA